MRLATDDENSDDKLQTSNARNTNTNSKNTQANVPSHPLRKQQKEVYLQNDDVDVIFQSDDVVVYRPTSNKGVLVSSYHAASKKDTIEKHGLLSAKGARKLGLTKNIRNYLDDVVFFRPMGGCITRGNSVCYQIRVDPERTNVFDQEFHAKHGSTNNELSIKLSRYLEIINNIPENSFIWWANPSSFFYQSYPLKPYQSGTAPELNAHLRYEVRVNKDVLPLSWFVKQNGGQIQNKQSRKTSVINKNYIKTQNKLVGDNGYKHTIYTCQGKRYIIKMYEKDGKKKKHYVLVHSQQKKH